MTTPDNGAVQIKAILSNGHMVSDTNWPIQHFITMFGHGYLEKPPFQRDQLLWPIKKRREFLERTLVGEYPIGVIVVYFLAGFSHTLYILDGLQRISTWWHWHTEPEQYGVGFPEQIEPMIRGNTYPVQIRCYSDHRAAADDFRRLNSGMVLTGYEFSICYLAALPEWRRLEPELNRVHEAMNLLYASVKADIPTARKTMHKNLRHDLALFYRFAMRDGTSKFYLGDNTDDRRNQKGPEYLLSQVIANDGVSVLTSAVPGFVSFVNDTAAMLNQVWRRLSQHPMANGHPLHAMTYSDTLLRFLVEARVVAKVSGNHTGVYERFVESLLPLWMWPDVNEVVPKSRIYLPMFERVQGFYKQGTLDVLKLLQSQTGIDLQNKTSRTKDAASPPLASGMVADHDERPFSEYGNGPTVPEVGSINSAKGKRSRSQYDADIDAQLDKDRP